MSEATETKPWFQFSIRELLIAMVAVAAVVALFVNNRPYGQTAFMDSFNPRAELQAICQAKGVSFNSPGASEGSGSIAGGGYQSQASFSLSSPSVDDLEIQVMPEWYSRIDARLRELRCDVVGESRGGEMIPGTRDFKRVSEFSFRYRQGKTMGVLRVYVLPDKQELSRVLVLLDEY